MEHTYLPADCLPPTGGMFAMPIGLRPVGSVRPLSRCDSSASSACIRSRRSACSKCGLRVSPGSAARFEN